MGWYRRSKFTLDVFHNFSSKVVLVPKTPIQQPVSRINPFPPTLNNPWPTGFSLSWRNMLSFGGRQYPYSSPFTGTISRRSYSVDNRQIRQYIRRKFPIWIKNPRVVFMMVVTVSGIAVIVYFGRYETIPYTKRNHLVILTNSYERELGEKGFEEMKASFRGKVLHAKHPESVRVRLIAKNIIEALQRELKKEQPGDYGTLEALSEGSSVSKEDEIHDDKSVEHKGKKKSATGHLEGVKWEVIVVNKPVVNACCLPGGKIVVFTGLLKHFQTDSEIAAIIGHEVAHVVARHSMERMTKYLLFIFLQLILFQSVPDNPDILIKLTNFLLIPFKRRNELEADYIGLLLMASAGYDPRVAPKVFKKLEEVGGGSSLIDEYLSTHPSGKKRAKLLAKAKVMQEALAIYHESMALSGERGGFNSSV